MKRLFNRTDKTKHLTTELVSLFFEHGYAVNEISERCECSVSNSCKH